MRVCRILCVLFTFFFMSQAYSQKSLATLRDSRWISGAISRYKIEGLKTSVGNPGKRITRTEVAMAGYLVSAKILQYFDQSDEKIKSLETMIVRSGESKTEELRSVIASLKAIIQRGKSFNSDVVRLQQLTKTYDREFRSLGIDLNNLRSKLSDVTIHVTCLPR